MNQVSHPDIEVLYELSDRLSQASSPADLLDAISVYAQEKKAAFADLAYIEENAVDQPEWLEIVAAWSPTPTNMGPTPGVRFRLSNTAFANLPAFAVDKPTLIEDIQIAAQIGDAARAYFKQFGFQATAMLPLRLKDRWIGVASLYWNTPINFTADDQRLYTIIAQQLGWRAGSIRALEEIRRQTAQIELQGQVNATLSIATDEKGILAALTSLEKRYHFNAATLAYLEQDAIGHIYSTQTFVMRAGTQELLPSSDSRERLDMTDHPILKLAFATPDQIVFIEDIFNDPRTENGTTRGYARTVHAAANILIPLKIEQEWQGSLSFQWATSQPFDANLRSVFEALQPSLATTVAKRRLYLAERAARAETEAARQRAELVAHINAALSQADDEQHILAALDSLATRYSFNLSALSYIKLDANNEPRFVEIIALRSGEQQPLPLSLMPVVEFPIDTFSIATSALANFDKPLLIEDAMTDPRLNSDLRAYLIALDQKALILIPLRAGGGQWQGVVVFTWRTAQAFGSELREIITTIAPTLAAVVATYHLLRQTEALYRSSAQRLDAVIRSAPLIVSAITADGTMTLSEGKGLEMLGLKPGQVVGQPIDEVYRGEPEVLEAIRQGLSGRSVSNASKIGPLHFQNWFVPEFDVSGNVSGTIGVSIDVTERMQSEKELEQQRTFFRQVIDANPSLILTKDSAGRLTLVNQALAHFYNTTVEQLLGNSEDMFSPNHEEVLAFWETDRQVLSEGTPLFIPEEIITNAHGAGCWFQTIKIPLFNTSGEPTQLLVIATDISERKQAEAEREQLLTSEQEARREAQEAVRLKDMFLATMSHELRTPLNAMIGFQHLMLMSGQLDADNAHMAERSIANSQRLLSLINNVLDISRMASGGMQIVPVKMSPRHLALNIYDDLKLQATEKGLTLNVTIDEALPDTIIHDEERLGQVISNLVGNAIKFTERGEVSMDFARYNDRLLIQVTDTGIGMPVTRQHVIFDEFVQLDNSTTRRHQGAGLGLAIVKRLMLLLKGTITVESELGKGSAFKVDLPLELTTEIYHYAGNTSA